MELLFGSAFADRLSKFAQFFSQPSNGGRKAAFAVAKSVGLFHKILEFGQLHNTTLGPQARVNRHSTFRRETVGEWRQIAVLSF